MKIISIGRNETKIRTWRIIFLYCTNWNFFPTPTHHWRKDGKFCFRRKSLKLLFIQVWQQYFLNLWKRYRLNINIVHRISYWYFIQSEKYNGCWKAIIWEGNNIRTNCVQLVLRIYIKNKIKKFFFSAFSFMRIILSGTSVSTFI